MSKTETKKPQKSAKPGTTDVNAEPKKKGAHKRPDHPAVLALKEGELLQVLPPDFDFKKFRGIKRKLWAEDWMFFQYRAAELRMKADNFDRMADEHKKLGGKAATKIKSLNRMMEKFETLKKQLADQGIDVEAALKSLA